MKMQLIENVKEMNHPQTELWNPSRQCLLLLVCSKQWSSLKSILKDNHLIKVEDEKMNTFQHRYLNQHFEIILIVLILLRALRIAITKNTVLKCINISNINWVNEHGRLSSLQESWKRGKRKDCFSRTDQESQPSLSDVQVLAGYF